MPLAPFPKRANKLDRAMIASVAAMLAMNVVVLSQQLHAAPLLAISGAGSAGLA